LKGVNRLGWADFEDAGLTNHALKEARCDRCTISLKFSVWKGQKVFYSKSKSARNGFLCVQCATSKKREAKRKVTIQELDEYIQKKFRQIIKRDSAGKLV